MIKDLREEMCDQITMVPCYLSPLGAAVTSLGKEGRVVTT